MWRDNDTDFIAELREVLKEDMAAIQRENIDLATERQNPEISWEEFGGIIHERVQSYQCRSQRNG